MSTEKKLLVIDDEEAVREAVSDILETVDIEVLQAHNGEFGISMVQKHIHEVGCILLDMRMPGINGPEALLRIREVAPDLYVIASTGYSVEVARKTFGDCQPDEFLTKPYDITTLITRVQKAFDKDL